MISDFRSIIHNLRKLRTISLRLIDSKPERPYTYNDLTGREARTVIDIAKNLAPIVDRRLYDQASQKLTLVMIVYIDYLGFNLTHFQNMRVKFSEDQFNWGSLRFEARSLLDKQLIDQNRISEFVEGISDIMDSPRSEFAGKLALFKLGIL